MRNNTGYETVSASEGEEEVTVAAITKPNKVVKTKSKKSTKLTTDNETFPNFSVFQQTELPSKTKPNFHFPLIQLPETAFQTFEQKNHETQKTIKEQINEIVKIEFDEWKEEFKKNENDDIIQKCKQEINEIFKIEFQKWKEESEKNKENNIMQKLKEEINEIFKIEFTKWQKEIKIEMEDDKNYNFQLDKELINDFEKRINLLLQSKINELTNQFRTETDINKNQLSDNMQYLKQEFELFIKKQIDIFLNKYQESITNLKPLLFYEISNQLRRELQHFIENEFSKKKINILEIQTKIDHDYDQIKKKFKTLLQTTKTEIKIHTENLINECFLKSKNHFEIQYNEFFTQLQNVKDQLCKVDQKIMEINQLHNEYQKQTKKTTVVTKPDISFFIFIGLTCAVVFSSLSYILSI